MDLNSGDVERILSDVAVILDAFDMIMDVVV